MSENNKIGSYKFVGEGLDVEFRGGVRMGVVGKDVVKCGGFDGREGGLGIGRLNEENYRWVVWGVGVELDEMGYE